VSSRQDIMDERLATLEDKIANIQVTLDLLPDTLTRYTLYTGIHLIFYQIHLPDIHYIQAYT